MSILFDGVMNMDNYIGYLSPEGKFHHCPYYGHMDKAKYLVNTFYGKEMNGAVAEDFLLQNGWCVFYARHFGWNFRGDIKMLSTEQRAFLHETVKLCLIEEKVEEIKAALRRDDAIRNTPKKEMETKHDS